MVVCKYRIRLFLLTQETGGSRTRTRKLARRTRMPCAMLSSGRISMTKNSSKMKEYATGCFFCISLFAALCVKLRYLSGTRKKSLKPWRMTSPSLLSNATGSKIYWNRKGSCPALDLTSLNFTISCLSHQSFGKWVV